MSKMKRFENTLDECMERLVKGEPLDQVLQRFPEYAEDLRPLLQTVATARRVLPVQPRPEFRERARRQLNAALQEKAERKRRPAFNLGWLRQPVAVTAAVLVAISLAGTGTVAAARGSMPDSPLYPVKLASEQVRMTMTFSDLGKAELSARLADERVEEIAYLAVNDPDRIPEVSDKMKEHLGDITSLLARAPVTMSPASVPEMSAFTATAPADVPPAAPPVPAPAALPPQEVEVATLAAPAAGTEAVRIQQPEVKLASSANDTERDGKKEPEKPSSRTDKKARLKSAVEDKASSNSARLRSILEITPESARAVLQRAIDESEAEYKRAIEALDDDDDD